MTQTAHLIAAATAALNALEIVREGGRVDTGMIIDDLKAGLARAEGRASEKVTAFDRKAASQAETASALNVLDALIANEDDAIASGNQAHPHLLTIADLRAQILATSKAVG